MIYRAAREQIRAITEMAKLFETCTAHVLVDVEYAIRKYETLFDQGIGYMFGMEKDGQTVGGLGCIKGEDLHYPRTMLIETFWFVRPEYRGEGIKLMDAFEFLADELGCDCTAMIHLSDSMPDSLARLYEMRNYELVEKHYIRAKTQNNRFMRGELCL